MEQNNTQLDKIIIPDLLLADMYKHSLVVLDDIEPRTPIAVNAAQTVNEPATVYEPVTKKTADQLTWLGGFNKRILIIVNEPDAVYLNDADMLLITKMLEAVKISLADVAIVNNAQFDLKDHDALSKKLPANFFLLFDVQATEIGAPLKIQPFQVLPWNGKQFLFSPSLTVINTPGAEQVTMKKNIWTSLKKIFDAFQ
ncbi:hypothetical protein [Polluticaenibacter yanchengensis]|uniref:Uncharacterized protein n=1 Tax=Polluticaenibacter yanchengensis TaxID=3014562 RepID=A0ABT4ULQ5_9BACT|nr:hypothetical protein [Chitinophagaceae bacterium LY-5]